MSLSSFFSTSYLLETPPAYSRLTVYLLVFFLITLLTVIYIKLMPKDLARIYGRLNPPFMITGFLGLIYLFVRYEELPYFSTRGFLLFILVLFAIWSGLIIWGIPKMIKELNKNQKTEDTYIKYLPKSKKSKSRS